MLTSLWQFKVDAQTVLVILAALLAWRRGAGPERLCAGTFVMMAIIDRLFHGVFGRELSDGLVLGHLIIDLSAGGAFYLIAIRANRMYPLWLTSLQLAAIVSHVAEALEPGISRTIYGLMIVLPSYLQIPTLLAGIWLHDRRTRTWGKYPSWLSSSGSLPRIGRSESPPR